MLEKWGPKIPSTALSGRQKGCARKLPNMEVYWNRENRGHLDRLAHWPTGLPKYIIYRDITGLPAQPFIDQDWSSFNQIVHYTNVIMSAIASQITSLTIVYSAVYSGIDQRKYQSSASLAFVRGIPTRRVSSAENVSIWWRHHVSRRIYILDHCGFWYCWRKKS